MFSGRFLEDGIFPDEYLNHLKKMPFRAVSTFWIAHPNNNLINNAAAGSQVNNTKVHRCFFAFLFVSVLVYMSMQQSMW